MKKRVALTFDDGPRPASTFRLQKTLNRHGVRATFFVVGKIAEKYPWVVTSLFSKGHEIANHTWDHPNIQLLSSKEIRQQLEKTRRIIKKITRTDTRLFRTSGSTRHYLNQKFLVPKGYQLVLWNVHSLDHEGRSVEEITTQVVSQVQDGDIVLLHNGLANTVAALDCLIPALKNKGFEFLTVSELLTPMNLAPERKKNLFTSAQPLPQG